MATDTTRDWGQTSKRIWGEGDNRYFPQVLAERGALARRELRRRHRRLQAEADKVIYRPGQPIQVTVHAFDEEARPADSYRILARIRRGGEQGQASATEPGNSAGAEESTGGLGSAELNLHLDDHSYRGEIPCAPADAIRVDAGSTLQELSLEVVALDGEATAARTTVELQLLDDPAEFVDPRPDPGRLAQLASSTGGQVL